MTTQDIDIPEWWIETTLSEVIKTNISSIDKNFTFDDLLYMDTGSITENRIEQIQNVKISEAPSRARRLVKDGDIVYSTVRPNQKHFGFITNPPENLVVSTGFTVISSIPEKSDSKFLYYFLTQEQTINRLQQIAEHSTSTYPSIRPENIENLDILLPQLPEQKEIAAILSSFDKKIELLQKQNETLEKTAQTIFQEWFGKYSVDDELPEGWRIGKLGEISKLIAWWDRPENTTTIKTDTNIVPIFSNGISDDGLYWYTDKPRITEESITVSARGTIGYVSLKTEPYVPIVRLIAVIPNNIDVSAKYLFLSLKNKNISGTGTTQEQLTIPDFSTMEIIIPENNIMNEFTLIINSFYEKIIKNTFQVKSLSKARDELLPKLMKEGINWFNR